MDPVNSFLDVLNRYSGAIIALGTVTYAVATVTLIMLTLKYVRLTRDLVAAADDQVQHTRQEQKEKLEANKQGLHELTKIILMTLNKLPSSQEKSAEMIEVTLWTEEDLVDMRHLARGLSGKVIGNVFWAIYHLNGIRGWVHEVQEDHSDREKKLIEFPWEDYSGALQQAKHELSHLLELL